MTYEQIILTSIFVLAVLVIFRRGIVINNTVQYPSTNNYYYGDENNIEDSDE